MISPLHYVIVVVDGRQSGYSEGVSLQTLQKLFVNLGVQTAINLDGELRQAKVINISVAEEKIRFFYPASTRLVVKKIAPEAASV